MNRPQRKAGEPAAPASREPAPRVENLAIGCDGPRIQHLRRRGGETGNVQDFHAAATGEYTDKPVCVSLRLRDPALPISAVNDHVVELVAESCLLAIRLLPRNHTSGLATAVQDLFLELFTKK